MLRIVCILALLVWGFVPASACAAGKVRLTNGEWPPYLSSELPDFGSISHTVSEAFKKQGIKVEYGFFPWPRALALAKSGEWDGTVAWIHSPERERDFYYSDAIVNSKTVLFHLRANPIRWTGINDLAKYRIGVSEGYFYGSEFAAAVQQKHIRVESATRDATNLRKLLAGRIDVFPVDLDVATALLKQHFSESEARRLAYASPPIHVESMHLLMSKANPHSIELLKQFNKGLREITSKPKAPSAHESPAIRP